MEIIYSLEEAPHSFSKSIFLAGPTPRRADVQSWRPKALELLAQKGYDGVVFVPEERPGSVNTVIPDGGYPKWEHKVMGMSDLILFWVPRDLATLPAFTTNVEFGLFANSGKSLFGPPNGIKNEYLSFIADKFRIPQFDTFEMMADEALEILGEGAIRTGGEMNIPLFIWSTKSFQDWYGSQTEAGNRLDSAEVKWILKVGRNKDRMYCWIIHPNISVAGENRNKLNEIVIARPDICSAVLYKRRSDIEDTEIVLVREFRSPVRNKTGFIWELPGGSSPTACDPIQIISDEVQEEVGINIDTMRFKLIASKQMAGTFSSHHGILYSAELNEEELDWLKSQKDIPHGADYPHNPTGERVYTEVLTLKEIRQGGLVDWSNYGMICEVIHNSEGGHGC